MKSLFEPSSLQKGDKVAIVAMASKLDPIDIKAAINLMQVNWGVEVLVGESVSAAYFNFAGTDEIRLRDFQFYLDNPEVKAIFSARGGYGSSRIIDAVDFSKFKQNPKWIIGFSDITTVHAQIQAMGFQSIHGPMPKTFMRNYDSVETLKDVLFGNEIAYKIPSKSHNRLGSGKGQLVGGNLCMLAHLIGSPSDLDTDGKILFIEDISEYLYNIDRMMIQLKRAGKLKNLAGLIVGDFSDLKENDEPFGKNVQEIIAEHTSAYNYPICYDFPTGHEAINWAIPCGRVADFVVDEEEVSLIFESKI
ncbi:peptidase U61 LD-carboxypeptidase A [Emticicia oligotrophica DSM 17448]|uniref:Peptidase U61 LD-carboxypeptidase A n=1 Tax=Emticicia oligotrophica (strain DSM 17448 / CIP 109782 / MTCC 6937 / GPTSA100-15) TaxID=929562 RepID=A0ABM5MXL6_EMTOG|nr:LD-carboxypeptidase [Emticicia oligotrophica]AFK01896.1 peptidase U61 LD-carboxypeptidase A [Emticicia oligotrophica DSM 17448]